MCGSMKNHFNFQVSVGRLAQSVERARAPRWVLLLSQFKDSALWTYWACAHWRMWAQPTGAACRRFSRSASDQKKHLEEPLHFVFGKRSGAVASVLGPQPKGPWMLRYTCTGLATPLCQAIYSTWSNQSLLEFAFLQKQEQQGTGGQRQHEVDRQKGKEAWKIPLLECNVLEFAGVSRSPPSSVGRAQGP